MFGWLGRAVVRLRWLILIAAVAVMAAGATWGAGLYSRVTSGGFEDPSSESVHAKDRIAAEVGRTDVDLLLLYSSGSATAYDADFAKKVGDKVAALRNRGEVERVVTVYDFLPKPGSTPPGAPTGTPPESPLVSKDKHATYVAVFLTGDGDDGKKASYEKVRDDLRIDGLKTEVGGLRAIMDDVSTQIGKDIVTAEMVTFPLLLILLLILFRSVVAALTPLLIGGLAILGAFVVTRALTYVTDVSIFATNIITMIGMGLAIDYALFIVSRFREELDKGNDTKTAIERTMATAGRTIMVSGLILALSFAGLLMFPMVFMSSMGWGGLATVLVAMVGALFVLPALLAVLGPRVNALRVPVPWRRTKERAGTEAKPAAAGGAWARLAHSVMRRPVLYTLGTAIVLVGLAIPFLRVEFGGFDTRWLPAGTESRVVGEKISADFPGGSSDPIRVLVSGADKATAATFGEKIKKDVKNVKDVRVADSKGSSTVLDVAYEGNSSSKESRTVVTDIRALAKPGGADVLVGGMPAMLADQLSSMGQRLPWMALVVAGVTFVVLFLAFGSILLPIKAVLMNVVSIGASFGVLVWGFQDGYLSKVLDFSTLDALDAGQLIVVLAILFGLSTDYEVFLLSRVREEWDATGDNKQAVATGLQRTGGIITSAALLLVVVIGGFVAGKIASIKLVGVGMAVAIIVDATIVRALLVPATMRLLGRFNWWAPGPLGKVYRKYGIKETDDETPAEPPAPPAKELVGAGR